MATFISVPLKKSSEVDLVKPLSKFVTSTYPASEDQGEYLRAVEELNKLRKSALGRPLDKHESSLEILLRYYDQLCAVEPKFPFSENQLCLTFTWKDAFDKGSLFGGSVKLALASLGYEKTCVLFNVAALASQIASEQNLDNDEGLKTSAKYYQLASGAFGHIKDTVLSALNREPTMDISPETVGTLSLIMLAQAQEVFFLKATSDKMKDAVIAKLANQAADFYGDAFKQCQYKDNLPKEVLPVLAAKHCIMQANAELHQSVLAKQKKRFGEEIARLQHAAELVKTVASRYDEYVSVKDLTDKINRSLTAAKKDNDFIYHDRVPEVKDLEQIGKAALVKPTAITPPLSQKFSDLFEKMVPMAVQQSMSIYSQRKAETVNRLVGTMREATNLCNGVLASLNLPAALEDLSGDSIPQSIAEKARNVVQHGGLQSIEQLIKDLPELLTRNREILDESLKMLDNEETTDNELRTKFSQRWSRTPSGDLYKPLRSEGANFRNILDKAVQADQVVRDRYNTHCDMIALLCKPENELNAAIPSANPTKTLQGSEVVNVLRSLLAQLEEVKKERETIEGEIKSVTFDMSTTFLTALAQDGAINEEQLSLGQLDQLYGSYNQRVQASLRTQEELLGKVQTSHQEFSSLKQSNADSNQREEVLKKLASAHDSYMEISNNLREGTKFYNDLTEILLKFQNKCSDIVFARKTERDELLKDLQQSIAREPSAPAFNVPAYQSTPAAPSGPAAPAPGPTPAPRTVFPVQPQQPESKPQPPARPPPPSVIPQAASTTPASSQPAAAPTNNPPPMAPQAQGPPYPTYQGYPGYYQMPMGYNPYAYGQYNMPNMPYMPYQTPGQGGYPGTAPAGQPYPGYPQQPPQQQPYYPQQ
ncbi:programmed cell death 6-interacting protein isoform X2 [Pundamilia nyererei]|uniref:Programmed cell death 6-interacting protein n=1 Tax=Pundamilia nyererei TaxID=303518 RepID=A0A9Y3QTP4_9CICH|nr:PREDICTED: programmed cell death 6-interacting protein isoform X2 [Pundamilia nyererei]XP_005933042.1 programmed cell death 6-interacting protein isoform X2 [Haplochromis burtoni]